MTFQLSTDCWYLSGPTASGKSALGVELAECIGAEIVSMDSMALYRHMDIGTAKPTLAERGRIPHHLIDIIDPNEEFSLAQYIEAAQQCAKEITKRGKTAIFVGGTPLYLKGLLRGIFQGPPADWTFRHQLQQEAQQQDPLWLHKQLENVDPTSAARLHPNDTRRLIRALEIFHITGRPISEFQKQFDNGMSADQCRVFVLDWPRDELHRRIDCRVDEMFTAGLIDEVRSLLAADKPMSKTAHQAVGYREAIDYIEGRCDLSETIELVKLHTRQLAKRQCTWFRSLSECRFITMAEGSSPASIVEKISE